MDNEYATLWYHPAGRIVHHQLHKTTQGEHFRSLLTRGAELFEEHGAQKWVSDDRANGALHPDDGRWARDLWSPRVIRSGWQAWAVVLPEGLLGRLNIKRFITMYADLGVTVQTFRTPDEALEWIRNVR